MSVESGSKGPSITDSAATKLFKSKCRTRVRHATKKLMEGTIPKHSSSAEMKLRVMQQCLGRLMKEEKDLWDIRRLLHKAIKDVENELQVMERMQDIALNSWRLQCGIKTEEHSTSNRKKLTPASVNPIETNLHSDNLSLE